MLRASDLLLTLAAVFLLNAALKSSAKSSRFTQASANQVMHSEPSDMERELYATHARPRDQMQSLDHWMSKIKRNLKQNKQDNGPTMANNGTSAVQHQQDAQQVSQYQPAHEVKVDFLRTNSLLNEVANNLRGAQNTSSSSTNSLYLLNYLLPQLKTSRTDHAASALPELSSNEIFDSSEQQQPPPFTLLPAMQQPGAGLPNQFQQQLQQQQPAIRQMLSNYQRYPQSRPLSDHQRQLLTQLQPRPPELHLRPPTQAPALGLANQNVQQPPLTPLQLLAGPFQAFFPGLAGQQQQPASPHSQSQQQQGAKAKHDEGDGNTTKSPLVASTPQQPNPFGAFLNPFNLQPPPTAANANGLQQQPVGQAGIQNLQNFYQQLPLYQALMAARQRQEALQAAQKMRDQQQQTHSNQPNNQPFGLGQPALTPPSGDNNGAIPPPFARLPPRAFGLPAQSLPDPNQLAPNAVGQNPWTPQPQQQANPYAPPPLNPNAHQLPQTPVGQPLNPTSNQNGPVHFDDDPPVNQQPQQQVPRQPQQQLPAPENHNREQEQDDRQNNNENNNNHEQNDGNQGDDNQNHGNNQDPGGHEQDNQGGKPAEEEDPDLKSFQNLANGGDSFTDLFPKGIFSQGDINEIKTAQAEQAKKQEEEERQRHLRQQQQQQQQQYNNQPMNQFAGNNIDNGNNQNSQQSNPNQQQGQNDNNQDQPEQGRGNQEGNDQNDDQGDGEEGGGDEGGGEGDGQGEDSPTAAALTTKSASNEKLNGRWMKSPGVEYARV